ncbi:Peptidyl-prolyl cis-trans isomerase CYP59 [Dichanthelium oligosanthes]|uniref:Peptidyl-prolyl cis-trans isomerase n=1 Tax=Dichanthelium oligosanthes TaxID=888268 RepID=A0A1E5USA2_9POAL|nr:Peptidyl-prolyl cis-trans isomerase CYP59 [Dichanthelium oligosanthes]
MASTTLSSAFTLLSRPSSSPSPSASLPRMKYYNGCLFHDLKKDFVAQTGDPTGTGTGGDSIYKFLYGDKARFFHDEICPELRHSKTGTVAMASAGQNYNASQVFGMVAEGFDTLMKINKAYVDNKGRPFQDIRWSIAWVKHTYVLDDPFDDPPQIAEFVHKNSPKGMPHYEQYVMIFFVVNARIAKERLEDSRVSSDDTVGPEELEDKIRTKEAHKNAVTLQILGDIPDAQIKPPDNVLFVCKIHPVTQDGDLYTIFSHFGNVTSAEIIRDYKTGDSLCFAFIDGCFKYGAPNHLARDCDQYPEQKTKLPNYVLKDKNTQRGTGGRDHRRSHDLIFDEEGADYSDKKDYENDHRRKIRRTYDTESELRSRGGRSDKNSQERTHSNEKECKSGHSDDKGSRRGKDGDWNRGKHDGYHSYSRSGDRSSVSYNDHDYSKHRSRSSRSGEDDEKDYRQRDKLVGEGRHIDDGYEVGHRKRSHRREYGGHRDKPAF